MNKAKPSLVV